ncbi:GTPase EngC [Corynebacterium frankenforstense DSM 45800]|uniref:Small ribosomal subunit biogenesis GTPase RsgA n=1 Tax=Corynebacterium frankenforstense DSM 45800 TaxID=1437875 RepID=A0A1L7CRG1_9CORY|nr:ribosome small subunit-dependent GTPase A [Corynebacterium frankenforstense]APT88422.1 GTPase EngC [Corynebacterium frankenforstense DSM 45800]
MPRRHYDESDVHVRPGKGSRPRTKKRPAHKDALFGMVVTKDRGRWGVVLDRDRDADDPVRVVCMRARELGRTPVEVGDRVGVVGDTSGREGTLARIVKLDERTSVLRRTADDTDSYERTVVANAELLLIVSAVADPPPRSGFVERSLVAAFVGGIEPVIVLTKSDLADPSVFAAEFADLDVPVVVCGVEDPLDPLLERISGRVSALIGHSGVGKSTLVNRLVPEADRATGEVSGVGKGQHTSTQSVALRLPRETGGGWIIDTPGIRSFGLAHVSPDDVIAAFEDLAAAAEDCPRGCTHLGPPADPECALDELTGAGARRVAAVRRLLEALHSNVDWE